jgi:hypothetical protein
VRSAAEVVDEALALVSERVAIDPPDDRCHVRLADDIRRFTTNVIDGRAVGFDGS